MFVDEKRIIETFTELVKIYSPPGKEKLLSDIIIEKLSVINLNYMKDNFGNIIAKLPAKEGIEAPVIFFSAHLDVVEPCMNVMPVIEDLDGQLVIRSSGETVLGADDKAGLAMILEAITCVVERDMPHGDIELILTLQEETGLVGAKNVDVECLNSSFGYILDHTASIGTAINRAPQHDNLSFTFKGKAAHAGLQPEEGINAILLASKAISKMPHGKLGDETTANVGTIKGGHSTNIIPDECVVTCEVRSHDQAKLNKYVESYIEAANEAVDAFPGTTLKFSRDTEYKKINIDPEEDLLMVAKKAAENIGIEFKTEATCGGSDANVLNYLGLKSVCLGCGYENPHSTNEYILVNNLVLGAEYVISIISTVIETEEE
ncbi:MAG: M20/M25/M40 family metallo-hydrolase [Cyanobacteriota bacterium]